jgi:hypothetical protein
MYILLRGCFSSEHVGQSPRKKRKIYCKNKFRELTKAQPEFGLARRKQKQHGN